MSRGIVFPLIVWLLVVGGVIVGLLALSGCTTIEGVCGVQPIGQDERGVAYFRYHCEPA